MDLDSNLESAYSLITKDAGKKIGGVFLSVKEVIIPNGGSKGGKHIKILVEIDLTQPLLRGTMVKMNGIIKWVEFRYECCPDFCYCCGMMGHNENNCKDNGRNIQRETQYGAWMKASNPRSPVKKINRPSRMENNSGTMETQSQAGKEGNSKFMLT